MSVYFALTVNPAILPSYCTLRGQEFNAVLNREQLTNAVNLSYSKSRKVIAIKEQLNIEIGKRRKIKSLNKGDEIIVPSFDNDSNVKFVKFTLV